MKLNLLATTAAVALLASGGMWAQAQAPGQKQDETAQSHDQKGAGPVRDGSNKSRRQHAQDVQPGRATRDQVNTKKNDTSKPAEQAQSKQPDGAADNQNSEPRANERDHRTTASQTNKSKGQHNATNGSQAGAERNRNQAAKDRKDQSKAAEQQKTGDQKASQSRQQAEQSKPADQPAANAAESKAGNANNQPAQNRNAAQTNPPPANQPAGTSTNTRPDNTASAKLSDSDRGKLFSTLKSEKQAANQRIDIQVNVGTRLPPRVHPRPLPRTVVEVMPQYRGYQFVMVRDEIAIVRPGTREVVDVIREPGSSASYASTSEHRGATTIHLTDQQRTRLREEAGRFKTSQVSSTGSQCLSLQPVPASLANENPDLKQYQMLAIGDNIVLFDPDQKKIVDVIQ